MKRIPKQDRNGVRTPTDIERRYPLTKLDEIIDYDTEIKDLQNNKVDKVAGKNLSTNDFTNTDKNNLDENTEARHTHVKTDEELSESVENSHTHSNKEILDTYTKTESELEAELEIAVADAHTHNNKALLDSYTNTNSNISNAISNSHSHSNKSALDSIVSGTSEFDLSSYTANSFSMLRSTCISKNRRVCVSLVGSKAITARTTTTILNLPTSLRPATQKDFVAFGTTSAGSTCGFGNISTTGAVSVWFPEAITTYVRANFEYDIDY